MGVSKKKKKIEGLAYLLSAQAADHEACQHSRKWNLKKQSGGKRLVLPKNHSLSFICSSVLHDANIELASHMAEMFLTSC